MDSLTTQAERERAGLYILQVDQKLSTAAVTSNTKELAVPPDTEASVIDDGEIEVVWYDRTETDGDPPWGNDSYADCRAPNDVDGTLGALEYELDETTIVHQGGGIWEHTDEYTRVYAEPNIAYTTASANETSSLELKIVQLEEGNVGGSKLSARADHSKATALTNEIQDAARNCDGGDVAFQIESSYHEGWAAFLEDALGEDENPEVEVIHREDEETVEAIIEGVRESGLGGDDGTETPSFIVDDDQGVMDPSSSPIDPPIVAETGPGSQPFQVGGVIKNIGFTEETQTISVSIWNDEEGEVLKNSTDVTLGPGESENIGDRRGGTFVQFGPEEYTDELTAGNTYNYTVSTEDDKLDDPGSFYYGHSGTEFELANGNATVDEEQVTITADLHNTGVEDGEQNVTLDLDLKGDELEDDPYTETIDTGTANRTVGENAPIELPINRSVLVTGTYDATIETEDDELEVTFDVDTGIDPGRVGLGEVEDAEVTVEVLGTQASRYPFGITNNKHQPHPMTLEIVTDDRTEHAFENPQGGNNINIGPTWQDKSNESYRYEFEVDEKTNLTLRNTRYEVDRLLSLCSDGNTSSDDLPHYTGPKAEFVWCNNVPDDVAFEVDASEDVNSENVRVRSAENNTIPALPAAWETQLSATEVLEQRGLVEEGDDELDLGPGEFVFLIENTIGCREGFWDSGNVDCDDEDGIDALWNNAVEFYKNNPNETHDPNFNDLIVYVEVEQAGVDPGKPHITISPDSGDDVDIGPGDSDKSGAVGDEVIDDTGIDIGSDYVVVG